MVAEPSVNPVSAAAEFFPVLKTTATNMVNGEELHMILGTTGTRSSTIGNKNRKFEFHRMFFALFGAFRFIRCIAGSYSHLVCCPICPVILTLFFRMPSIVGRGVCNVLISMRGSVCFLIFLFLRRVFVRHNKTTSHQLAALTRQAGERQLGVSIA